MELQVRERPASGRPLQFKSVERPKTWRSSHAFRLPGPNIGPGVAAVTVVTHQRRPILAHPRDVVGALDQDLGPGSKDGHATVVVACFMPDHVHLMVRLDGKGRSLSDYVNVWKGLWTRRLALAGELPFWQRTFFDHWMRRGEDLEYARYIVANPVRRGLVGEWREYPFTRAMVPLL
jgi:putative transposase